MNSSKPESFKIDHTSLKAGVYKRYAYDYNTFDIRVVTPYENGSDYPKFMDPRAVHTLEHIFAYRFRKRYPTRTIYVGPMGCLTGFYFVTLPSTLSAKNVMKFVVDVCKDIIKDSFTEEDIPGATKKECGNYKFHDLEEAKRICRDIIENFTKQLNP